VIKVQRVHQRPFTSITFLAQGAPMEDEPPRLLQIIS